jgi:hypothetical protein
MQVFHTAQFVLLRMSFVLGIMLFSFAGTTVMDRVVASTGGTGVPASLPALLAIMFQIGAVQGFKEIGPMRAQSRVNTKTLRVRQER